MPIFNPPDDSISENLLDAIRAIELSGGGGNPRYRYAAAARIDLRANEPAQVLPPTPEPVSREVRFTIAGNSGKLRAWWGGNPAAAGDLLEVGAGEIFYDPFDGGQRLSAIADSDLQIDLLVRQDKQIAYSLQDGGILLVPNTNIELWIDTTFDYGSKVSDFDIYDKIQSVTQSDDGVSGHKLFYLTGFALNEPLSINVASAAENITQKIQIQWISQQKFLWLMSMLGLNQFLHDLPADVIGEFSQNFLWAGETANPAGGEIIVRPTLSKCLGRVVATNGNTGVNDSCVITGWQPDADDPKKGGTLTLGGF